MASTSLKSQRETGTDTSGKSSSGNRRFAELQVYRKKRPTFLQQQAHTMKRLRKVWKQPRGNQSKMRMRHRGKAAMAGIGYRGPTAIRGLTAEGKQRIVIHNMKEFQDFVAAGSSAMTSAVLSSTLGMRQRTMIVQAAVEKDITFANIGDGKAYLERVRELLAQRKAAVKTKVPATVKETAAATATKAAADEKKTETAEEKRERETQEMRKILEGTHAS